MMTPPPQFWGAIRDKAPQEAAARSCPNLLRFRLPRIGAGGLFFLLAFCLPPLHAQAAPAKIPPARTLSSSDREAVYQKSLPLYGYDASKPLAVKRGPSQSLGTGAGAVHLERFSYLSAHGQRVPALLFQPANPAADTGPIPCIIILHGLGGSKEFMAGYALAMAKFGYASLVIDEYGQGERGPLKTVPGQEAGQLGRTVAQTAVDVRRGIDYLETRREIDAKRIGLAGVSLGAIVGTVAAGVEPRIKACVLISGGGDWGVILKTLAARNATVGGRNTAAFRKIDFGALNARLAPEDPLTFAPHIAPRPVLMLGGRRDTTIVPQAQTELFDALRQPKQIVWYPQFGHVPPPEVVFPAMQTFFRGAL